ncbi:two-component system regulatory protein YycI [Paenibacillus silviterrae]|jgi:regulatory protein YycI of two-component signal transduction system YycFG|uniref:two-component system regulatory protein YycI n=1 Tax=Paenibacillus silviterrae TaxID=3242194 RepID=UPI002542B2B4|nr:two-component system regulatory protein YycI [Paenibacillus chinjuensis]
MDWSRAKTILIFSFLLLNVVLAFQLWSSRSDLLELEANPSTAVEEVQRLLKSKNITVPVDLPKDVPRLKEIVARFDESIPPDRMNALKTPFRLNPLISGKGTVKDVMSRTGIPKADSYQFDPVMSGNGTYIFNQMYGNLPMFEVQLKLTEKNGQIVSYSQGLVEVQPESEQKEQKVISPYIALRSLIETYLPAGSVITSVQLGYHGQVFNSQQLYMIPYWRVSLGNGDLPYFVHAFTGAVDR